MSGTLTYLGGMSVGALVPGIMPSYGLLVAELQTKLAAQIQMVARLRVKPPTLVANLAMALQMVAALQAAISLGMPGVDFQIAMCAKAIALIRAKLTILLGLPFATAGIHAYAYDGDAFSFGAAVAAETSGGLPGGTPRDHINGVMYLTDVGAAWGAMGLVLKTG